MSSSEISPSCNQTQQASPVVGLGEMDNLFTRKLKAQHQFREQQVREMQNEFASIAIAKAELPHAAASKQTANDPKKITPHFAAALTKIIAIVQHFHQQQVLVRIWSHWHQICRQNFRPGSTSQTTVPVVLSDMTPQIPLPLGKQPHLQQIARRSRRVSCTRSQTSKMPRPAWR
ncbi:unnamed protein product [Phytophthora fragariaefolia]|uniref:Unnamed protein product n=1 Tax=Phytophthora fragariaefolia TaxID=1490495 RepID=A0A9W6XUS2_9STRA|nr:unnamed protein product [Phytophthora fragariaefolia]